MSPLGHAFLVGLDEASEYLLNIDLVVCDVVLISSDIAYDTEYDLEGRPVEVRQCHVSVIEQRHVCV